MVSDSGGMVYTIHKQGDFDRMLYGIGFTRAGVPTLWLVNDERFEILQPTEMVYPHIYKSNPSIYIYIYTYFF